MLLKVTSKKTKKQYQIRLDKTVRQWVVERLYSQKSEVLLTFNSFIEMCRSKDMQQFETFQSFATRLRQYDLELTFPMANLDDSAGYFELPHGVVVTTYHDPSGQYVLIKNNVQISKPLMNKYAVLTTYLDHIIEEIPDDKNPFEELDYLYAEILDYLLLQAK